MNRILAVVLLLCLLTGVVGCKSDDTASTDNQISMDGASTEELVVTPPIDIPDDPRAEDVYYLFETLADNHKNLFFKTPRNVYEEERAALVQRIPQLNDVELYHALQEFVAKAGDAHTSVGIDWERINQYDFQTGLPFAIAKIDGAWRFLMCGAENSDYLGMELLAIDGVPIGEVYQRTKALVSHETEPWMEAQFSSTIQFIDALAYLGIANSMESVVLTLGGEDGETKLMLPAMDAETIMAVDFKQLEVPVPQTGNGGSYYRFLPLNEEALFIQYNTCAENPDLPMADFTSQVEAALNDGNYSKVLVDLRYNTGGNSAVLDPFTAMLSEKKDEQGFALYCLIGTRTFSSGIINAIDMKEIGGALIGVPTGGSVNGYGEIIVDQLPNLPVLFTYSTEYFNLIPDYGEGPLHPDIPLDQSYVGYLAGADDVVQFILEQ